MTALGNKNFEFRKRLPWMEGLWEDFTEKVRFKFKESNLFW
jgi:hypothetical protein